MKTYYSVIKMLRRETSPPLPVHVRRIKLNDNDGYCSKVRDQFYVRININFSEARAIDTLLHEWAHALSWKPKFDDASLSSEDFERIIHGPSWGVAYAEVYRLFEKHFT